jgi:hypothetical protein
MPFRACAPHFQLASSEHNCFIFFFFFFFIFIFISLSLSLSFFYSLAFVTVLRVLSLQRHLLSPDNDLPTYSFVTPFNSMNALIKQANICFFHRLPSQYCRVREISLFANRNKHFLNSFSFCRYCSIVLLFSTALGTSFNNVWDVE